MAKINVVEFQGIDNVAHTYMHRPPLAINCKSQT